VRATGTVLLAVVTPDDKGGSNRHGLAAHQTSLLGVDRPFREPDLAPCFFDATLGHKFVEVAMDRHQRHLQPLGQGLDRDDAAAAYLGEDGFFAKGGSLGHGALLYLTGSDGS